MYSISSKTIKEVISRIILLYIVVISVISAFSWASARNSNQITNENNCNIPIDILADSVHEQFRYVLPNNTGDKIISELKDSLKGKTPRIKYHYTLDIRTVEVDPCYYEIEHVYGNTYRLRSEFNGDGLDGYYEFDTYEPITSVNGLYQYVKRHHIKPKH